MSLMLTKSVRTCIYSKQLPLEFESFSLVSDEFTEDEFRFYEELYLLLGTFYWLFVFF